MGDVTEAALSTKIMAVLALLAGILIRQTLTAIEAAAIARDKASIARDKAASEERKAASEERKLFETNSTARNQASIAREQASVAREKAASEERKLFETSFTARDQASVARDQASIARDKAASEERKAASEERKLFEAASIARNQASIARDRASSMEHSRFDAAAAERFRVINGVQRDRETMMTNRLLDASQDRTRIENGAIARDKAANEELARHVARLQPQLASLQRSSALSSNTAGTVRKCVRGCVS